MNKILSYLAHLQSVRISITKGKFFPRKIALSSLYDGLYCFFRISSYPLNYVDCYFRSNTWSILSIVFKNRCFSFDLLLLIVCLNPISIDGFIVNFKKKTKRRRTRKHINPKNFFLFGFNFPCLSSLEITLFFIHKLTPSWEYLIYQLPCFNIDNYFLKSTSLLEFSQLSNFLRDIFLEFVSPF